MAKIGISTKSLNVWSVPNIYNIIDDLNIFYKVSILTFSKNVNNFIKKI